MYNAFMMICCSSERLWTSGKWIHPDETVVQAYKEVQARDRRLI